MKSFKFLILALSTLLIFTNYQSSAQSRVSITGRIVNKADATESLIGAIIKLNPADTLGLKKPGRVVASDFDGGFSFVSTVKDNKIEISYLGFKKMTIDVPTGKSKVDLGNIRMSEAAVTYNEARVTARSQIGTLKGDTTQFNAAAFKTNPDASSEDLLKKMPGVSVGTDGKLEAQGESIGKVYVNGKEYFGDDPALALKNMPSDAVESIQIYDDKTDDAKFSGYDDGTRVKTVNIVTKKNVINSIFGKMYAGYGTDNSYTAGVGANIMRENHRLTIVGQSNNINNQGFTMSDISSSSSMRSRGGAGNIGTFTTPSTGGIMNTNNIGITYSGEVEKKLKMSGNYFYNNVQADNDKVLTQDYLNIDRYYDQISSSDGTQGDHRFNGRIEWTPTEKDRIVFSPYVNVMTNYGSSVNKAETFDSFGGTITNMANNNYSTTLNSYTLSSHLWYTRKLNKPGRTITVGGYVSGNDNSGDRTQYSLYGSAPLTGSLALDTNTINQIGTLNDSGIRIMGAINYNEPISKRSSLNVGYRINYDNSSSNRLGLNYDQALQDFALLDTATTSKYQRNYTTHTGTLGYSYNIAKKLRLSANVRFQHAQQNSLQNFPVIDNPDDSFEFNAILPRIYLKYTPSKMHSLNLQYYTTSNFPSVNQLQEVWDVSNVLQVSTGNPLLNQSYNHKLRLQYNYNNPEKNINFYLGVNATTASNYIANHRYFLEAPLDINGTIIPVGAQVTKPVNLDGYYNAGMFTHFSTGINPIKSNLSVMAYYRYTHTPSIENNIEYTSMSNTVGGRVQLTSNISEKVDFTVGYSPSVSLSHSSTGTFDRYERHNLSANFTIYLWKGFYVEANGTWHNTFGTQESYTQHYGSLNASIAQKFYKNQFEIKLSAYDILDANQSMWQSTTDTYTQTVNSNVLQQYFMASLMWKFDTRKSGKSIAPKSSTLVDTPPPGSPPQRGGGGHKRSMNAPEA